MMSSQRCCSDYLASVCDFRRVSDVVCAASGAAVGARLSLRCLFTDAYLQLAKDQSKDLMGSSVRFVLEGRQEVHENHLKTTERRRSEVGGVVVAERERHARTHAQVWFSRFLMAAYMEVIPGGGG